MEFSLRLRDAPARRRHKTEEKFPVFNVCFGLFSVQFRWSSDDISKQSRVGLEEASRRQRKHEEDRPETMSTHKTRDDDMAPWRPLQAAMECRTDFYGNLRCA